jgi:UDP-glucose 4-epimerase
MRALVVGGAGFIGSNLVDGLIKDNHIVAVWDNLLTGKRNNVNPKAHFINCDIAGNYDDIKVLMSKFKPDVVFHLAAMARVQPSIDNPIEYHNVNVNGTLNMLNLCVECGVKRFVFSSSSSVYGDAEQVPTTEECELNPMSPYALHKLMGEQYCKLFSKLYGLETVCLRYFNVYGERQYTEGAYCLVMGVFAGHSLKGEPMTINGDGEQTRDFTYVGDVVDANIKCATTSPT